MADPRPFSLDGPLPRGLVALEASAGTGKTYTIAGLVVRYVAEDVARLDQVLVVTFTRAATAELRSRVRQRLVATLRHLRRHLAGAHDATDDVVARLLAEAPDEEVRRRVERLETAVGDFDTATISTIHGFCQAVLSSAGFAGDVDATARLAETLDELVSGAVRDAYVDRFAGDDTITERPTAGHAYQLARLALQDPRVQVEPTPDDDRATPTAHLSAALAHDIRALVEQRKRALGVMGFDDLLVRLASTLQDDDAGRTVVAAFQHRYRVALVDEFQDTDPVQWEIVRQLFRAGTLVLIGDPKQAIYRFRGADVQAYLDAVRTAGEHWTLPVNWRSDARYVRAVNTLFEDTTFGDHDIVHRDVSAADGHEDDRLTGDHGAPLEVRVLPLQPHRAAEPSRALIARDVAAEVTRLLSGGSRLQDAGAERVVLPRDIAVLVRRNEDADRVHQALADAGVPAVINGVGSVLQTQAAPEWVALLSALDRPSSSRLVRALAITRLVDEDMAALAADPDLLTVLHDDCHRWARILDQHGVAALFRVVATDRRLHARLLGEEGGSRHLTDLEHVAELLHGASSTERLGAAALAGWIVAQGQQPGEEIPSDQLARRLESDAEAVQVLTIHRSKGLEFPIVLLPDLMFSPNAPGPPQVYRDGSTRVLDVGSSAYPDHQVQLTSEEHGEQLRLLYVAATRARHRTIVWFWWLYRSWPNVSLSKALFEHGRRPRVEALTAARKFDGAKAVESRLDALVARSGGTIAWRWVEDDPVPVAWQAPRPEPTELRPATFLRRVDHSFTRSSFSALTSPVTTGSRVRSAPDDPPGRDDEHDAVVVAPPDPVAHDVRSLPMEGQPAGTRFGTLVHAVLEHVDFAAVDLDAQVAAVVARQARHQPDVVPDRDGLARALVAVLRTPLPPALGGAPLAGLTRADRLDELEFELPLVPDVVEGHVTVRAIGALLREHLDGDDPLVTYAARLDDATLRRQVHGFLTGSIDLVLRDGAGRFHVIDHKSNRLHGWDQPGSTWDYRHDALVTAMVHGHYLLQALLYQVALRRFLQWRLPASTRVDDHLGAVGYLFLRGMVGPDTPVDDAGNVSGVFAWQPPARLVADLSDLLDRGTRTGAPA